MGEQRLWVRLGCTRKSLSSGELNCAPCYARRISNQSRSRAIGRPAPTTEGTGAECEKKNKIITPRCKFRSAHAAPAPLAPIPPAVFKK